ncbi:MAG TPA: FKBP-type peptidyl-prolyl cis-trans isomerase [Acidimicrobiales bacterium]
MATTKRQRQKEARRQKMEALEKQSKRRQNLRRGIIALVVAVVIVGSAALFFQKSTPATVSIPTTPPTTTTTVGITSTTCSTSGIAVAGFASIPCASPAGTWGKAPTMVVPTTPAPKVLEVADLIKGTGVTLKLGDKITAQYVLADYASHKDLQSSWTSGAFSATFANGQLIPGWLKGMPGMKVGGRRELIVPSSLAYGPSGQAPIPGNDTLVFIVDLLKIG